MAGTLGLCRPDHNVTHMSVKLALFVLFLEGDFDQLNARRSCPYQSWAQEVERAMSLLNLAWQATSIARTSLGTTTDGTPQHEAMLQHMLNQKKSLREALGTTVKLTNQWRETLEVGMEMLQEHAERMNLRGVPLRSREYATDAEVDGVCAVLKRFDSSFTGTKLTDVNVDNHPKLKRAMQTHMQVGPVRNHVVPSHVTPRGSILYNVHVACAGHDSI